MKHITTYTLFEGSKETKIFEAGQPSEKTIRNYVGDILLDLSDIGYKYQILIEKAEPNSSGYSEIMAIIILIKNASNKSDTKDTIDRLASYLNSEGFTINKILNKKSYNSGYPKYTQIPGNLVIQYIYKDVPKDFEGSKYYTLFYDDDY